MAVEGKTQELVSMTLNMLGSVKGQENMRLPCLELRGTPSRTQSQGKGEVKVANHFGRGGTK